MERPCQSPGLRFIRQSFFTEKSVISHGEIRHPGMVNSTMPKMADSTMAVQGLTHQQLLSLVHHMPPPIPDELL